MAKKIIVKTPIGVAAYPYLTSPDANGRYADNKYKTKLVLDPKSFAKFKDEFTTAVGSIPKGYKLPWSQNEDGQYVLSAKSKFRPKLTLPDDLELDEHEYVAAGSTLRIACEIYDYEKGFALQLLEARVYDLKIGAAGGSYFNDEDEDDGYDLDDEVVAEPKSKKRSSASAALDL